MPVVLILLPPSEGKAAPARRGRPTDLDRLSLPELTEHRTRVLSSLIGLSSRPEAATLLGLGPQQAEQVRRNVELGSLPGRPALEIYTGVLFSALDHATLSPTAKRRAAAAVRVQSALWGPIGPSDRIAPYRLSIGATLPAIGPLASFWRRSIERIAPTSDGGVILDCRSSGYASAWRGDRDQSSRTVAVRVLTEVNGRLAVVSHAAKHTRGLVARAALSADRAPRSPQQVADLVGADWRCELVETSSGWRLDVITGPEESRTGQTQAATSRTQGSARAVG